MNRRSFMASILASATAPYVCTAAGVLMPVRKILTPAWPELEWVSAFQGDAGSVRFPYSADIDYYNYYIANDGQADLTIHGGPRPLVLRPGERITF